MSRLRVRTTATLFSSLRNAGQRVQERKTTVWHDNVRQKYEYIFLAYLGPPKPRRPTLLHGSNGAFCQCITGMTASSCGGVVYVGPSPSGEKKM